MTDGQKLRAHSHLHKISRQLFGIKIALVILIALVVFLIFCALAILGNQALIMVMQTDTLNAVGEAWL